MNMLVIPVSHCVLWLSTKCINASIRVMESQGDLDCQEEEKNQQLLRKYFLWL